MKPDASTPRLFKRRSAVIAGAAAFAMTAGLAATMATPAQAVTLLTNPGFESGALSPWTCSGGLGSVVGSPVHSGAKALAGAANSNDNAQCTQTVSVQPNTAYTLSAFVQGYHRARGVDLRLAAGA